MKKSIRIGVALFLAIGIVLGAFYLSIQKNDSAGDSALKVTESEERKSLEVADSDGDGIPDWEEELTRRAFEQISVAASTTSQGVNTDYTPPTTFTGQFAEAFMEDYLQGKIDGVDYSNPQPFVDRALTTIEKSVQSKKYSRNQFTITEATLESVRMYGNDVAAVMQQHSVYGVDHELVIVQEALENSDPERLEELVLLIDSYQNMLNDMFFVEVPDILALQHIELLNILQVIIDDLEGMRQSFTDPLFALARIGRYPDDAQVLLNYFVTTSNTLTEYGVVYTNTEPGSFFYIFDAI